MDLKLYEQSIVFEASLKGCVHVRAGQPGEERAAGAGSGAGV